MPNARVIGETWYPTKCDMVSKEAVCETSENNKATLKAEVCSECKNGNSEEDIGRIAH